MIGDVCFCHATPHADDPIFTRITPTEEVRELLGEIEQRVVVCGHTHMQFDRDVDGIRVVNAGSVGMPYGTTEACWALLDGGDVQLRRTPYDLEAAAELRHAGVGLLDRPGDPLLLVVGGHDHGDDARVAPQRRGLGQRPHRPVADLRLPVGESTRRRLRTRSNASLATSRRTALAVSTAIRSSGEPWKRA